jgi:hypothetical protein
MNVKIGTEAAQFLFWENINEIFGIESLQCIGCCDKREREVGSGGGR